MQIAEIFQKIIKNGNLRCLNQKNSTKARKFLSIQITFLNFVRL